MSEHPTYEIIIGGHLSEARTGLFGEMTATPLPDGQTLISGQNVDQSALFGVLLRIRDLGIPLISVNRLYVENQEEEMNKE